MKIGVPKETAADERRVALTPDVAGRLGKSGLAVLVERGAGEAASFGDEAYRAAGATVVPAAAALFRQSDVVLKVQPPSRGEVRLCREGAALVAVFQPSAARDAVAALAARKVTAFSLALLPRITRAQAMDVLSSQATVAGYKAVLLAANALQKFFPMLMTAAGTVRPARVLVIGAGVAGLQAIATARRIGAVVEAFDTRPVVKEQVKSLGAKFIELDVHIEDAQDAGGYAKELSERHIRREKELIHNHALQSDVIITTALVPGKPAPMLVSAETVHAMRPGSVIVDLAGEQGGNCELTVPGETVVRHDVTIIAPLHISSDLAYHASQMYAKNVAALVALLAPKGELNLNFEDDIINAVCITADGEVRHNPTRLRLGLSPLPTQTAGSAR